MCSQKTNKNDYAHKFSSYLAPKHWPLWFTIGLLRASVLLPSSIKQKLGSGIGRLIYLLASSRKRVAKINIKQAYPNYTPQEIDTLNKQSFKSLGISIFEMGTAWFAKDCQLRQHCEIEGKEYLDKAIEDKQAIILLTGHFTTLEIGSRLISFYCDDLNAVYKKAKNPLFNAIMVRRRKKYFKYLIDNKDVRTIIKGLKEGSPTWFAPDQDFSKQNIVFTPFLGGIASTLTATSRLAKITNASVIPFYPVRLENGKGFKLVVLPALENFPSNDIEADSARVNKVIEEMVYQSPEQYLWSHKRFKTQHDGRQNNIYKQ